MKIVEERPALDVEDAAERVRDAYAEVVRAERAEERAAKEVQDRRSEATRARLECGRELMAIRKQWPARGPKAKGWGEFLRAAGIAERTARDLMVLAGYVEDVSAEREPSAEIPTITEAIEARREQRALATVDFPVDDEPAPMPTPAWVTELTSLVEEMQRHVKAAFSKAEQIERLCAEHAGSVGSPSLLTTKSMLVGVRATVTGVLTKMGGN